MGKFCDFDVREDGFWDSTMFVKAADKPLCHMSCQYKGAFHKNLSFQDEGDSS